MVNGLVCHGVEGLALRRSWLYAQTMKTLRRLAAPLAALAMVALGGCAHAARPGCSTDIPTLFDRVSPAVVMISAQSINPYKVQGRVSHIIGSGFIYDTKGLIITNSHVAFGRQTLYVTLDDGSVVPAHLLGADPIFDIAVLQIPKPEKGKFTAVPLGDSEHLRVGENVIAIGNPLGLDQTVTRGIVSGVNRILPDTPLSLSEPLIQTDTSITYGNSGGGLYTPKGELVGINTSISRRATRSGSTAVSGPAPPRAFFQKSGLATSQATRAA